MIIISVLLEQFLFKYHLF